MRKRIVFIPQLQPKCCTCGKKVDWVDNKLCDKCYKEKTNGLDRLRQEAKEWQDTMDSLNINYI